MAEENVKKRFYRGKLPKLVWDKERDRKLCDFAEGHLTTEDPRVIRILESIGYIEIPLDATVPPELYEAVQPEKSPDVRIIPKGVTEEAAEAMVGGKDEVLAEDHDGPAVPVPKKATAKPKNTPSKKPKKSRKKESGRSIKRRTKK